MAKKLIIFGNGLGMALDPDHFNLKNAMERVWNCDTRLDHETKNAVGALKGIDADRGPLSENDLLSTQIALNFLTAFRQTLGEDAEQEWFTPHAQKYPETLRKYIFDVAHELFNYALPVDKEEVWRTFLSEFVKFVATSRTHVATLNYDDLLYDPIVEGHIVDGTLVKLSKRESSSTNPAPYLRDGFISGEYRPNSFEYSGDCGFYLHLHGTPLFTTKDNETKKLNRSHVEFSDDTQKRHIVLANRRDKETIIAGSPVLKDYWDKRLPNCIAEATEIILFGYSGEDTHLNKLIKKHHSGDIRVVEWNDPKAPYGRQSYWDEIFHKTSVNNEVLDIIASENDDHIEQKSVVLIRMDNILKFSDWEKT